MTYAKIGSKKIVLDDSISADPEQVRAHLKALGHDVDDATVRSKTEGDTTVIEFLPKAGRKG